MNSIELKNYHLIFLTKKLSNCELSKEGSRIRKRFFFLLQSRLEEIEKERKELINEYVKKDESGKPIIDVKKNIFLFEGQNEILFNLEYQNIFNEPFIIDILPSNESELRYMKTVLSTLETDMTMDEFKSYEEIENAFKILEEDKPKDKEDKEKEPKNKEKK